jgi:Zn-dependent protease with chaperone function
VAHRCSTRTALGERKATAGGGELYVTTGLLQKSNEAQLAGVLTHDLAHDDPGHVAKAQALGAELNVGLVIVDHITPGTRLGRPPAHLGRSVS